MYARTCPSKAVGNQDVTFIVVTHAKQSSLNRMFCVEELILETEGLYGTRRSVKTIRESVLGH